MLIAAVVIIILVILIYLVFAIDAKFSSKEYFKNVINKCNYFDELSELDLIARNSANILEYRQKYINSFLDFSVNEKKTLNKIVHKVFNSVIALLELKFVKWYFVKVIDDNTVELGLPHTMDYLIVLPESLLNYRYIQGNVLDQYVIHELIHIHQKYHDNINSNLYHDLYRYYNYVKTDYNSLNNNIKNKLNTLNVASNPDVPKKIEYLLEDSLTKLVYNLDGPNLTLNFENSTRVVVINNLGEEIDMPVDFAIINYSSPYEIFAELLMRTIMRMYYNTILYIRHDIYTYLQLWLNTI